MGSITKVVTNRFTDRTTGECTETQTDLYSYRVNRTDPWGKMFLKAMSKAIGVSGDENTVLIRLIQLMDKNNMVDLSSRKKQDIIIFDIYYQKDKEIDTECSKLRAKASRRFSQLVTSLKNRGLIAQKNISTYMVDDEYFEFTYPDSISKKEKRSKFMNFSASIDKETGEFSCKFSESNDKVDGKLLEYKKEIGDIY